jgi:hypothetical protein
VDQDGVGTFVETLTLVETFETPNVDDWLPYVPATEYDKVVQLSRELLEERDAAIARAKTGTGKGSNR